MSMTDKLRNDFLSPFSIQQRSALLTILLEAETFSLDVADMIEIIRTDFEQRRTNHSGGQQQPKAKSYPVCPGCGSKLYIRAVNVSRCTNVGGDWQTSLECSNSKCLYTTLSTRSLRSWSE